MTRLNQAIAQAARAVAANMGQTWEPDCSQCQWPTAATRLAIAAALEDDVIQGGLLADYQGTYEASILQTWQYYADIRSGRTREEAHALRRQVDKMLVQICLGRKLPRNAFHQRVKGTPKGFWKFHLQDDIVAVYCRDQPDRITMTRLGNHHDTLGINTPATGPDEKT